MSVSSEKNTMIRLNYARFNESFTRLISKEIYIPKPASLLQTRLLNLKIGNSLTTYDDDGDDLNDGHDLTEYMKTSHD